MKKRIFLAFLVVLVIFAALASVRVLQVQAMIEAGESFTPPPVAVDVKTAQQEDWVELLGAVGTVNAIEGITVRTTLSGIVERIAFQPGTRVDKGDLLIELDREVEKANLVQAEAELDLAERQLLRAQGLIKSGTISVSDLDDAIARQAEATARVASLRAILDKKTVNAPFTGELGIKQISLGQYLNPGDSVVELQALDQVFVQFSLPQQHLPALAVGLDVQVKSNAYPERTFDGKITAVNPQIDPSTRNVMVQATFDNPQHRLRSGMYVSVDVILPEIRSLVTVPATSVLYAAFGNSVFVVEEQSNADSPPQLIVQQRIVRLGITRGDFVEIVEGVEAGDRVVSAGAFKLRNGQAIVVSEVGVLPAKRDPQPGDS